MSKGMKILIGVLIVATIIGMIRTIVHMTNARANSDVTVNTEP